MISFFQTLLAEPLWVLAVVITLGLALGKVRIAGVGLDAAGVVFVALGAGALGLTVPALFQSLGLVLFVYTVGIQAGPGLSLAFSRQGLPLSAATLAIGLLSLFLNQWLSRWLGIDPGLALGLFTGARSSNSALAVAVESSASVLPSLGHAVAYPLGMLGAMFFVRFLPALSGRSLEAEAQRHQADMEKENPPLDAWTVRYLGRGGPLQSLGLGSSAGVTVARLVREGGIILPRSDTELQPGDLLRLVGARGDLEAALPGLGERCDDSLVPDIDPEAGDHAAEWVTVRHRDLVNRGLGQAALGETWGATVTRIQRNGLEITPRAWRHLRYGDRLMVVAPRKRMGEIKAFVGDTGRPAQKDFLPLFLTLVLGLALGHLSLDLGGISLSLGNTGGVLMAAMVVSVLGRTGGVLWHVSDSTLRLVARLGLVLFLSAVGTQAGGQIGSVLSAQGPALLVVVLATALLPLALVAWWGLRVMKMNLLVVMGMVAGGTTSTMALGVIGTLTPSTIPTVAYASTFPLAMVLMMVLTQVMSLGL